ncbi:endolytic transglycosylase MltG [Candidatus Uhrbacteria bacterium]|nr:endolytic transglycosylase MltG [Candidatus Uhrbacteria bacterium]
MLRIIGLILGIGILVGIALSGSFVWDSYFLSPDRDATEIKVEIPEGSSVDAISKLLKKNKIISSRFLFKTYTKFANAQSSLQAGVFVLKPQMSFKKIVASLTNAQAQEIQLTIPEGFSLQQIGQEVEKNFSQISVADWDSVTNSANDFTEQQDILSGIPSGQGLEGYLFPDTYRFRKDADAKTIAETMIITLKRRLAENNIIVPDHLVMQNGMTFHQVLTLASIVEREVRSKEDMAHVAGIFLTRLKIGMALQADSTVNFVTGKQDSSVSITDSKIDSPYNTYKFLGLPPGPISNPGMNAIQAVLNPSASNDLYFLTTPAGQVIYSKTFDDHIANKYKYLK